MNTPSPLAPDPIAAAELAQQLRHELQRLRSDWWWFLALGVGLCVLGAAAVGGAFVATLVTVVLFGVLLLIAGTAQTISAFWTGQWSGFLLQLMVGLLYVVTGMLIIHAPAESAMALTLLLALLLIVCGLFRMTAALVLRFPMWGFALLSGSVSLLLGVLIYRQWPASGLLVIGLFVGIELLFNGLWWIMLALDVRRLPAR